MSHTTSDALLQAVAQLRALFPDWRFGQLVANLTTAAGARNLRRYGTLRTGNSWQRPSG